MPVSDPKPPGPVAKLLGAAAGILLLVAAFMVSVVFLAAAVAVGLAALAYFWWKTRKLRQAMREHAATYAIEGEAVEVPNDEDDAPVAADIEHKPLRPEDRR